MSEANPVSPGAMTTQPRFGLRSFLLHQFSRHADGWLNSGRLTIESPWTAPIQVSAANPGPAGHIRINRARALRRVSNGGGLGLADSYIDGDWDSDDLTGTLELGTRNIDALSGMTRARASIRWLARLRHGAQANSLTGSRRNIMAHYDLGNDFYATWLDPEMVYSAAMFESPDEPLTRAQLRKFDHLARYLDLQPGDRLLEIGCGWGGFAIHAARNYGARVTALTISPAQAERARERVAAAGLDGQVEIRLQDYRETEGEFDKIASIEMFEAVGEKYWPVFFGTVHDRLRPGGKAAMQIITIDDDRFENYRRNPDFIQMRVFPGGMLPGPSLFRRHAAAAGLDTTRSIDFGGDYARTLQRWQQAFTRAWPDIQGRGFDERFRRLWTYYLSYCEAGFRAGHISVSQLALVRN